MPRKEKTFVGNHANEGRRVPKAPNDWAVVRAVVSVVGAVVWLLRKLMDW